jgi:hypothetical protein
MACNPQDLLDAARCFVCLSPTQAQVIRIRLLCAIATSTPMAACDPNTLLEAANCLMCLSPGQLQAIEISLLCQIASGAGTGGGGATCGIVDPVAAPTGSCGLYYRTDNGAFWAWTGAAWLQLIAP